ncbi:hypothetical protein RclHR1_01970001 [Rhizophagus clarus]|uniref:Uncharacterized protein n=1 Tax=Rhizophagus clarus TaxID=94130 RepID=A0A2Z6R271_9GLOM|nr:hypothetical protein RclHR1_01970001 [Rhizophagus clarus]
MAEDITVNQRDMKKLFKAMQISIFYQHQHHLISECETTIYTMHQVKGGLHVVDILTNFAIRDNKGQAYVIQKVYFFKSRVMDYYIKLQDIQYHVKYRNILPQLKIR